jgi:hypothetical protein
VQEAVLRALSDYPRLTFPQLVRATRINRGSVWRALMKLHQEGKLRACIIDRRVYHELRR